MPRKIIYHCNQPNCNDPHIARGLCSRHYQRLKHTLPKDTPCRICGIKEGAFANYNTCRKCSDKIRRSTDKEKMSARNKRYYSSTIGKFKGSKAVAKRRGLEWSLSFEDYEIISKQLCFYCGGLLGKFGSGLDRVDNNEGYTFNNVVACCAFCNRLKGDYFSASETQQIIKFIKELRKTDHIWASASIKARTK